MAVALFDVELAGVPLGKVQEYVTPPPDVPVSVKVKLLPVRHCVLSLIVKVEVTVAAAVRVNEFVPIHPLASVTVTVYAVPAQSPDFVVPVPNPPLHE